MTRCRDWSSSLVSEPTTLLSEHVEEFAAVLTSTVRAVVPGAPEFVAELVGTRFTVAQNPPTGIRLDVDGHELLTLKVEYRCCLDSGGQYLAIESSTFVVIAAGRDGATVPGRVSARCAVGAERAHARSCSPRLVHRRDDPNWSQHSERQVPISKPSDPTCSGPPLPARRAPVPAVFGGRASDSDHRVRRRPSTGRTQCSGRGTGGVASTAGACRRP